MKTFIVTRIGDVFTAIGMFILWDKLGTLSFRELAVLAPQHIAAVSDLIFWATLMILGGAVGKSAQLPLNLACGRYGRSDTSFGTDHAATMVTGVCILIARTHELFITGSTAFSRRGRCCHPGDGRFLPRWCRRISNVFLPTPP